MKLIRPAMLSRKRRFEFVSLMGVSLAAVLFIVGSGCRKRDVPEGEEILLQQRSRAKIQTMDPMQIGDVPTDEVSREFFETLYYYHYLKRPYEMAPLLAAAMPEISEDGCTYRIPIRRDVYFHDDPCFPEGRGRQLTAHDFVYTIKRIANIKAVSKNWWIFDGRIAGLNEFREYTRGVAVEGRGFVKEWEIDYSYPVEGLAAPDAFTLQIKLTRPWPQLVYWLAHIPSAPMAREAVEFYQDEIRNHAVGTGPYMLKRWVKGNYIDAVRNPRYREDFYPSEGTAEDIENGLLADAGRRVPRIDRILWRSVEEDQPRWLLFMRGRIDINTIPKDNYGQAVSFGKSLTEEMQRRGIRLQTYIEPDVFYLGFNMTDPVLGPNKPLRMAINYATDREKFIELLQNGRGIVAHGFISPAMAAYDPNVAEHSYSFFDLNQARAYLREAEAIHGGPIPRLRIAVGGTDTTYRQLAQFHQRNLQELGLDVEIDLFDWPTFLEKMRKNQLQLIGGTGWMADYPDTESFLQVFYSQNASWPNSTNYSSAEFDRIYEQVSVMPPGAERTALYRQAERIVMEDMPVVFVYHRIGYILYHDWVGNFKPNAYKADCMGAGFVKYYTIDTEKRRRYWNQYR